MSTVHDRQLLDLLEQIPLVKLNTNVFRVTFATRNPLVGSTGGGRWSPAGNVEVLYTSLERDGAMAEAYHHLSLAPVMSSANVMLNRINCQLESVMQLTSEAVNEVERFAEARSSDVDTEIFQEVGGAAHLLEADGILVPSVRWECNNLVVFLDHVDLNEQIELMSQEEFNWPAWREQIKAGNPQEKRN